MDASIERAQPRGVASSGVGADANNASNAAPTTRGSSPETSAVAPETWLRSSTPRTALISSSVALAGGRSALGDRESNSESANARIGSGTSGGNAADRSDSRVLPNTECLYVPATVRKKSRPFSRCSTSIPSIGTPGSSSRFHPEELPEAPPTPSEVRSNADPRLDALTEPDPALLEPLLDRSSSDTNATPPLSTALSNPRFTARAAAMRAASATVLAEEETDAASMPLLLFELPSGPAFVAADAPPSEESPPSPRRVPATAAGEATPPLTTSIVASIVTSAPGRSVPALGVSVIHPGDTRAASPGAPPVGGTNRQLAGTSPTLTSRNVRVTGSPYRKSPTSTVGFSSVHRGCDAIS